MGAGKYPLREGEGWDPRVAPRATLGGRLEAGHMRHLAAVPAALIGDEAGKLAPGTIGDVAREAPVAQHACDVEVLEGHVARGSWGRARPHSASPSALAATAKVVSPRSMPTQGSCGAFSRMAGCSAWASKLTRARQRPATQVTVTNSSLARVVRDRGTRPSGALSPCVERALQLGPRTGCTRTAGSRRVGPSA